jgi:hypothetical protein
LRNRAFGFTIDSSGGRFLAGIFLSYAREDFDCAQALAAALKRAGHSVWWDSHIRGGA